MEKDKVKKDLYDILGQEIDVPNSFSHSISNVEYKKKKRIKVNIYRKVAIAFSFVLVSINLVTYGLMIKENYRAESSIGKVDDSIQQAVENGYIQNVEMDYLYCNNIGAKIDYVIMSDYNLNILFNFDVSMNKNKQNIEANIKDLLIHDENDNIIYCCDYKTYKRFCKNKNIMYNKDKIEQYAESFGGQLIEMTSNINKTLYTITTTQALPKSEKLYIQFNTIYFDEEKNNKIKGNWNFELHLREQFYNREEIKYELETQSKDIELINANITNTTMRITYKMKKIDISKSNNIITYIEDNLGNRYDVNEIQEFMVDYNKEISVTFPITANENLKYLILYISIDKQEEISVILKPKD